VIAVVSGEDGARRALTMGALVTIDRTRESVFETIVRHAGAPGPTVIFDVVGGEVFERSAKVLGSFGRLVALGVSAGARKDVSIDLPDFYRANRRIVGVTSSQLSARERGRMLARVVDHLVRGDLVLPTLASLPLAQADEALRRTLAPQGVHGKIVLTV
jgi:NADPH:quinone reductase-like Zn-dependent oxidoreductase